MKKQPRPPLRHLTRHGRFPGDPRWRPAAALVLAGGAAALAAGLPVQAQIQRWVDERGIVHYSDAAPQQQPAGPVTSVDPAAPQSAAEQAAAAQRLRQYRDTLAAAAPAPTVAASAPAPVASAPAGNSCAAQWARYNAAYQCMDPYRMSHGGIRPDAFTQCPVLPQPDCPPPGSP